MGPEPCAESQVRNRTGNPKTQSPKPKLACAEISNPKTQIPSKSKTKKIPNLKAPNAALVRAPFDYWGLELTWDLELGIWDFAGSVSRGNAASMPARSGSSQGGSTSDSP